MKKKIVYVGLSLDIIHHGHINLIKKASSYGDLIIGLITDKALESYKKLPLLEYESRKKILDNIKGVKKILNNEDSLKLDEIADKSIRTENLRNKLLKISSKLKELKNGKKNTR